MRYMQTLQDHGSGNDGGSGGNNPPEKGTGVDGENPITPELGQGGGGGSNPPPETDSDSDTGTDGGGPGGPDTFTAKVKPDDGDSPSYPTQNINYALWGTVILGVLMICIGFYKWIKR